MQALPATLQRPGAVPYRVMPSQLHKSPALVSPSLPHHPTAAATAVPQTRAPQALRRPLDHQLGWCRPRLTSCRRNLPSSSEERSGGRPTTSSSSSSSDNSSSSSSSSDNPPSPNGRPPSTTPATTTSTSQAATPTPSGVSSSPPPQQQQQLSPASITSAHALAANQPHPPAAAPWIPHRWRVVWMMAVAFVLCNMDKVNMSVAVIPMAHELNWTATERGLVSSSFFWGYSLTQIPAGWVSTKIGGAKVLMAGVALWSFGTMLAPPAAKISIYALCASRMLVGLGEGFAPSAATAVMAATVPPTERSRAVTTVFGGLDVGSVVGLLVSGPLIARYGWPSVFYLFAVLGGVWCLLWPLFNPDKSDEVMKEHDECGDTTLPERCSLESMIVAEVEPPMALDPHALPAVAVEPIDMPWGAFFTSLPVWAITVAHFCFNWGYYTLLAWLPSYFELALGLDVKQSSFLTLVPYVAMAAMTPLVGPIADGMVHHGVSLTRVRKVCQGVAFLGPAVCMLACAVLTPQSVAPGGAGAPAWVLVTLLSISFALGAWARAGLYCNHQDLSPKYAGALLGITNTAGALPGVLGVTAAGMLLDATNSWSLALFYPTAVCQLFGFVFYSLFASSERQKWK